MTKHGYKTLTFALSSLEDRYLYYANVYSSYDQVMQIGAV